MLCVVPKVIELFFFQVKVQPLLFAFLSQFAPVLSSVKVLLEASFLQFMPVALEILYPFALFES